MINFEIKFLGQEKVILINVLVCLFKEGPGVYPGFSKGGGEEPNSALNQLEMNTDRANSPNFETVVSLK